MPRATRWVTIGCGLLLALVPVGCGSNLTGGSIPPGRSRAAGIVVRGDNANVAVPGAALRFVPLASSRNFNLPGDGDDGDPPDPPDFDGGGGGDGGGSGGNPPGTVVASTNQNGEFTLDGLPTGRVELTVLTPPGTALSNPRYELDFGGGASYWIMAAPLPLGANLNGLSGIEVSPSEISQPAGQSVQIIVRLLGGDPPAVVPTYLVRGDMGIVNEKGRFTAIRPGRGTIRVIVGRHEATIAVNVASAR